jgi:thiol-disulfide isomerase/thioredoxin
MLRLPLFLLLVTTAAVDAEPGIRWFKNLSQASAAAQETGRPMMIDFWADWCEPCKVMDATVYSDATLAKAVDQKIIAVRIHFDMQREIARKYNTTAIPYLAFTNSYGTELMHHRGFLGAHELIAVVNALPADVSELNRLDRLLQQDKNDFEALLAMGQQLRSAGFFESSSAYYQRAIKQDGAKKHPGQREFILREMGLNFLELKHGKQAARAFETCVKEFPKSENRPASLLNLAQAHLLEGQREKARKVLETLMVEYPQSEASRKAGQLANSMR